MTVVLICSLCLCYRVDRFISAVDETRDVTPHKKQKKNRVIAEQSSIAPNNTNSTSTQSAAARKKKKKKKKNSEVKLPTISDDRLKAYGINPKKFKYFHQKKLMEER